MKQCPVNEKSLWETIYLSVLVVFLGFSGLSSAQDTTEQYREEVQKIYIAYYGRPGDPVGVDFWSQQLADNSGNLDAIIDAFGTSQEFEARYGDLEYETLVNNIYINTLNRNADPAGLAFYVDGLTSARFTLATIALDIAYGIHEGDLDATTFENKLIVARAFTEAVETLGTDYSADEISGAVALLSAVDDGSISVDDALAAVDDFTEDGVYDGPPVTIAESAINAGNLTTLIAALQATGLDAVLADESATWTVFAPTDNAFAALGEDTVNALLADPDTLSDILLYHVIAGTAANSATAINSLAGSTVETANGDLAAITARNGTLFINNSQVVLTDLEASNGIIHVIDSVLIPPETTVATGTIVDVAVADGRFTTLVAALQATGLDATLADRAATFTVFAPTDDAFAELGQDTVNALLADTDGLANILLYHVIGEAAVDSVTALSLNGTSVTMVNGASATLMIDDGALFINQARVIITDIVTDNGIIHVIDAVITPPETILDAAVAAGDFTILVTALQATGLDQVLADTDRQFTAFAPTDNAFAVLGDDTINSLLADIDTLSNILLYHVIADVAVDTATAVSLADSSVTMANGDSTTLSLDGENLFVNDAQIVVTDIITGNGIIHVIDAVLIPPVD